MTFQVNLTNENRRLWEWAFTLLSMERIVPFYSEMDIPEAIISFPSAVQEQARQLLTAVRTEHLHQYNDPKSPLLVEQSLLNHAFHQMAQAYGEDIAAALHEWCVRYALEEDLSATLSLWDHLFRRICGLISDDQSTIDGNLEGDLQSKICNDVRQELTPGILLNLHQRIEEARNLPVTDWEKWLDEMIRHSAGEAYSLSIIDLALEQVETIARNQCVFHLWETLRNRLTDSERARLFTWGRRQADEIGIPVDVRVELI